jgi:PPOX class probable F420-dependent enzyme
MRKPLPPEEFERFVAEPYVSILATYRANGDVLLAPVWHEWHDGGFNVIVEANDAKARNLRRDPRASLAIADNDPPYRGCEIRTQARLTSKAADDVFRRIAIRYLGEREGVAYADSGEGENLLVRLESGELRSWDFAGDF